MNRAASAAAEEELYNLQAQFCKGMAHPKRIRIMRALKGGEKTVTDLAKTVGLSQANVSQHLALLREFGLLSARHDGTRVYYSISDGRILDACELVRGCIAERLRKSQLVLAVRP